MKYIHAVGLVLVDRRGCMLIIREKEDETRLKVMAGMLSVPTEIIVGDESKNSAMYRLILNKIKPEMVKLDTRFVSEIRTEINFEFTEKLYLYEARCYEPFTTKSSDGKVEHYGWLSPYDFLVLPEPKRVETEKILLQTFAKKSLGE